MVKVVPVRIVQVLVVFRVHSKSAYDNVFLADCREAAYIVNWNGTFHMSKIRLIVPLKWYCLL